MTNAPETRKTHITRIFGTNRSGDVLDHMWADVERIDVSKSRTQTAEGVSQGLQRKYRWRDDPMNGDDYTEEDADDRNTIVVKVCDPTTDNVDDPDEWIPIRVKKSVRASGGDGDGQKYQERLRNDNDDDNVARVIEPRRILHYDTSIDSDAQAAADAGFKAYVVNGAGYEKDLSSKDDNQHVEHEIIKFFKSRNSNNRIENDLTSGSQDVDSGLQTKLLNDYLIDESEPAQFDVTGSSGINPPYRLDPYQNIVNVKLTSEVIVAFVDVNFLVGAKTSIFAPADRSVKFLASRPIRYVNTLAVTDGTVTLFKVSASTKEFMTVTTPDMHTSIGDFLNELYVYVFALDKSDIAASIERAFSGAIHAQYARYLESHGPPDTPVTTPIISPPGMLWSVALRELPSGDVRRWKIRTGPHRAPGGSPLPNSMVQVYPLGPSYTPSWTVFGYEIRMYRLDPKGTGDAYGASDLGADTGAFSGMRMDPLWHQEITSIAGSDFGIPFDDPPPLVAIDVVNNN